MHMGTFVGHVAPGLLFIAIGLWHLFNHIKLYITKPHSYTSSPWFPFPTSKLRYLELFLIMLGSCISISMELFIGPAKHQPLDPDGTIPSHHLHNFEHSTISMTFFVYAAFAILLYRGSVGGGGRKLVDHHQYGLTQLLAAIAFGQQFLLFHLHSVDHNGVAGQYHLLLKIVVAVSLVTTLMEIWLPGSFMVSFVNSVTILCQGVWFVIVGYMLWTPGLIPKGCFLHLEEGHQVVRCGSEEALNRAKSLVLILNF